MRNRFSKIEDFIFFNFIVIYFMYAISAELIFPIHSYASYIINGFFLTYAFFIHLKYIRIKKFMVPMYLFYIYIFILVLLSSDILYSSRTFIKSLFPILFFSISFFRIKNLKDLNIMNNKIILIMILFIFNFFIVNLFNIGHRVYGEEMYYGSLRTEGTNAIAYSLIIIPLIIQLKKKRFSYYILIGVTAYIIVLLNMKRISILAPLVGISIFILTLKKRRLFLRIITGTIILLIIFYPLYESYLKNQVISRFASLSYSYKQEPRYQATILVFSDIFSFHSIKESIFGKEMFNSPGNYADGRFGNRQLHTDYNQLIHGSGILGILLYLFYNLIILKYYLKIKKKILFKDNMYFLLNATFYSIFFLSFFISFSGSLGGVVFNSIRYIYMGSIISIMSNRNFK